MSIGSAMFAELPVVPDTHRLQSMLCVTSVTVVHSWQCRLIIIASWYSNCSDSLQPSMDRSIVLARWHPYAAPSNAWFLTGPKHANTLNCISADFTGLTVVAIS